MGDSGIRNDLQTLASDGTLSYAGALQLLNDVASRGTITTAEFADLQTIAGRLESQNGITSSTYVASIFYQLVDGSAANETWVGGAQSSTQLGDLIVGTTSAHLNQLIGEWFLGADMPMPQSYGSATKPAIDATYQAFNIPLFGPSGTPQISDIAQGPLGDGELLASLADVLDNHADLIQSMFVDDGNGVYGVRFYVNGKETWVTVNSQLPVNDGSLAYNNAYTGNVTGGLWTDLVEKAYAQLSSDGNLAYGTADNAYYSINGGIAFYTLTNLTGASETLTLESTSPNWSSYKTAILDALNAHDDIVLESDGGTTNSSGQQLLVASHPYSVIGYDATTGDFIVRNPWGDTGASQTYVTQFEVSMSDVAGVKGDFVIDNSAAPNVVFIESSQLAWQTNDTNVAYWTGATVPSLPSGSSVQVASLFHGVDTAGLTVSQYMIQTLGDGTLQLNGATNLATAAQQAAGEVVVSAADLPKLLLTGGASAGSLELLVSGTDGSGWSIPTDISVTVDTAPIDVVPSIVTIISSAVPIAGLFKLIGPDANANGLLYEISVAAGYGQINLNGATNLDANDGIGDLYQVKVSAADLAKLTYMPLYPVGVLSVKVYDGDSTSSLAQIPIEIGYSTSSIINDFDNGYAKGENAVADSAANVFANLDQLEQMMPCWDLLGIALTDSSIPTETITSTQLSNDRGVLSIIESKLVLDVTATGSETSIQGMSNLATVVVYSGTANSYTLTEPGNGVVDVGNTALNDVVALQFSDHELIVASSTPVSGEAVSSAQITNLYAAVFAREPDVAGLNFYEQYAAANPTVGIVTYAGYFLASSEYTSNTAHNYAQTTAGETQFITDIYNNLLKRAPEAGAVDYYLTNVIDPALKGLTAGTAAYTAADAQAHATVLAYFSQSAEFLSDVQVTATHPADTTHWLVLT